MRKTHLKPGLSALLEVAVMFLPAIPAYVWMWPNVKNTDAFLFVQSAVYLYFLAGCLLIGLRRWSLEQLGMNRNGIGLSLICGLILIVAITLGGIGSNLPLSLQPPTIQRLLGEFIFYFGLVGFIEELLFRGLIYRALLEWRGTRVAILGSAILFGLYHVGWASIPVMAGLSLLGLVFGLIRWRAGGIVGLIVTHGLFDVVSIEIYPTLTVEQAAQFVVTKPLLILAGDILLLSLVVYLWKIHPNVQQKKS